MLVMEMGRKRCVDRLTFAPDGRALVTACAAGVFLWRDITDAARAERVAAFYAENARFADGGRWLFTGGPYDLVRVEPATGAFAKPTLWGGYNLLFDASPNAPYVLVSQFDGHVGGMRLALWHTDDMTPAGKAWEQIFPRYNRHPPRFLGDGTRFVRAEFASSAKPPYSVVRLATHDAATGAVIHTKEVAEAYPSETLVSPDGRLLALRGTNQITVVPFPPNEGKSVALHSGNRKHFTGMAFHPSGRFLAATSNDHTVRLLDIPAGTEERTFTWQLGRMRSVCFSPDGTLAAAGTDKGQVVVWDVDV